VSRMHRSDLILGGVRSGKSREALRVAAAMPACSRGAFLATAQALDGDMGARIARHRAERPAGWETVEEPYDVVAACWGLAGKVDVVVFDCLTLWVANLLLRGDEEKSILAAADALADFLLERRVSLIIVSNEVGAGVHPATDVGLRFRDALGGVNQRIAAAVDRVSYMVAGLSMTVKDVPPHEPSRAHAPEAP
jgi:adenosylcobinamide kinase / adenosylcobinamide-phosphate guanylyltransferase